MNPNKPPGINMDKLYEEVDARIKKMLHDNGVMTLGAMISALEPLDPSLSIYFDFCGFGPGGFMSYWGYYNHLAVDFKEPDRPKDTVGNFLRRCKNALGETFEGYKGGDFVMDETTPVWVDRYGHGGGTAIVGIREVGFGVVIDTRFVE